MDKSPAAFSRRETIGNSSSNPGLIEFREQYAWAQARASWASIADLKKPNIAAGFRHQVRKPARMSWARGGLLTFVNLGAGFRDQYALARARPSWGAEREGNRRPCEGFPGITARVEIHSDRERVSAPGAQACARITGFPGQVRRRGLASWGGARRNANERVRAARRYSDRRGRGW